MLWIVSSWYEQFANYLQPEFFWKKNIQQILMDNCYTCRKQNSFAYIYIRKRPTVSKSCWARFPCRSCLCQHSVLPRIFCSHLWDHLQSEHITETAFIFRGTKEWLEKEEPSFVVVTILASDSDFDLTLLCIMKSLNAVNVIRLMPNQKREYNTIILEGTSGGHVV